MKCTPILALMVLLSSPLQADSAINFHIVLAGENEVPPVTSNTSGEAILHVDSDLSEIRFKLDIRDGNKVLGAAGAHLHCAPAGSNGPVVAFVAGSFPPGYNGHVRLRATLTDDSIINPACGATIVELVDSMLDGNVYLNVHSTDHPGGVVRGQVQ